jgi:hypothetical protein
VVMWPFGSWKRGSDGSKRGPGQPHWMLLELRTHRLRPHWEWEHQDFHLAKIARFSFRTGSAVFHTHWVLAWGNGVQKSNEHFSSGINTLTQFISLTCLHPNTFFQDKSGMSNCSADISWEAGENIWIKDGPTQVAVGMTFLAGVNYCY